jgi:hypothetical protein
MFVTVLIYCFHTYFYCVSSLSRCYRIRLRKKLPKIVHCITDEGVTPLLMRLLAIEKKVLRRHDEFCLIYYCICSLKALSIYITPGGDIRTSLYTQLG